jgi:dTDP-4-dehydrorhamnose reductase
MIWLIGNQGMLGKEIERELKNNELKFIASGKELDITDLDCLINYSKNKEINWIINCSAFTAVDKAEAENETAYKINASAINNLTKLAEKLDSTLIHFSTDYIFDGNKTTPYTEDDIPNPINIYGKSKLLGEQNIINKLKKYFIFRTAWLYGRTGNNFPLTMIKLFYEKEMINVVNDQFGSPTYTKDISEFIIFLIIKDAKEYGIYNFTNEGKTTWYEFAKEIFLLLQEKGIKTKCTQINPISAEYYPTKAKRPKNSYLSKEKVKTVFNIKIRNWQDALAEFINTLK